MNGAYAQLETRVLSALQERKLAESDFNARALEVYGFQRKHNGPYGNYCKHLGAPAGLENWRQILAVPQSAFKHFALCSFPESETAKTFHTSGTTGEGFGRHHFCSMRLYEEAIVSGWEGLRLPKRPFYFLAQTAKDAPASSLAYMFNVLSERIAGPGASAFFIGGGGSLNVGALEVILHSAQKTNRPVNLFGTALAFLNLFEQFGPRAYELPEGSFAMETGGYKGSGRSLAKTELYSLFRKHLGLPANSIINEYGMTELSSQFYTRGLGNPHEGPPWVRALVIDPETDAEVAVGGTGVLRIFDLANLGSVIALQTQDLAIRRANGFELLGRDPAALPRGCSRSADEMLSHSTTPS